MSDDASRLRAGLEQLREDLDCGSFAERHAISSAACERIAGELADLLRAVPPAPEAAPECAHGHRTRQVGCVSCVLVFDRPAAAPAPEAVPLSSLNAVIAEMENYGAGLPSAAADHVWKWSQRLRALAITDKAAAVPAQAPRQGENDE